MGRFYPSLASAGLHGFDDIVQLGTSGMHLGSWVLFALLLSVENLLVADGVRPAK
jgi:hypothetical protein